MTFSFFTVIIIVILTALTTVAAISEKGKKVIDKVQTTIKRKKYVGPITPGAYYAVKPLTETEQNFYQMLIEIFPENIILSQVDMKRIVRTKRSATMAEFNSIAQLSIDYIICEKDFSIMAIIELDDASHEKEAQKKRDQKKENILKMVNLNLIRWDVRKLPTKEEIKRRLAA